MTVGQRIDPYLGHRFRVEMDGTEVGGFSEVTGLQAEIETEDYAEGGVNDHVHKLPKGVKYPNLILKRGITDADNLWKWYKSTGPGRVPQKIQRKDIRIYLLDSEGKEKMSWRCLQAYPVKWSGSDLKGDANAVSLESLELAHCGMDRV